MLVTGWKGLNSGYGMKGMGRREQKEKEEQMCRGREQKKGREEIGRVWREREREEMSVDWEENGREGKGRGDLRKEIKQKGVR